MALLVVAVSTGYGPRIVRKDVFFVSGRKLVARTKIELESFGSARVAKCSVKTFD